MIPEPVYNFLGWSALAIIFIVICLCCRVIAVWLVEVLNRNRDRQ